MSFAILSEELHAVSPTYVSGPLASYLFIKVALLYLHLTVHKELMTKGKIVKDTICRISILGHF